MFMLRTTIQTHHQSFKVGRKRAETDVSSPVSEISPEPEMPQENADTKTVPIQDNRSAREVIPLYGNKFTVVLGKKSHEK